MICFPLFLKVSTKASSISCYYVVRSPSTGIISIALIFLAETVYCDSAFLNLTTGEWSSGPSLQNCRYAASCNLFTNPTSGQREVAVVGGTNHERTDCPDLNEVEIINVDTQQVRNGK